MNENLAQKPSEAPKSRMINAVALKDDLEELSTKLYVSKRQAELIQWELYQYNELPSGRNLPDRILAMVDILVDLLGCRERDCDDLIQKWIFEKK